jgi:hypothetical protein
LDSSCFSSDHLIILSSYHLFIVSLSNHHNRFEYLQFSFSFSFICKRFRITIDCVSIKSQICEPRSTIIEFRAFDLLNFLAFGLNCIAMLCFALLCIALHWFSLIWFDVIWCDLILFKNQNFQSKFTNMNAK